MTAILLSLLLAAQLTFTAPSPAPSLPSAQPRQLWWGLIDPELSTWLARIPEENGSEGIPVMWNWSWRNFWAALTNQPIVKEAADASWL